MPRERDEGSGQYTESYPAELFLDAIRDAEDGFAGTGTLAETVGCSERLALLKLDQLAGDGRVRSRDIGRSSVWLLADEESESIDEESRVETESTGGGQQSDGERVIRHHAAVHEMYQYLREQTTATRETLAELIATEAVSGETREEFLSGCFDTLGRLDAIDPPEESGQHWRFVERDLIDRLRADPTTDALLDALDEGYSIVVRMEFLGETYRLRLRVREGVYYCDTPVNLHRHDTEQEMRACIEKYGHADATIESVDRSNA